MQPFDPTRPSFLECPYPAFQRQRDMAPIVWSDRYRKWFVFRHQDCVRLLQHPALSSQTYSRKIARFPRIVRLAFRGIEQAMLSSMLFQDSPVHERLRAAAARYLLTVATKELQGTIEAQVQTLLDAMPLRGVVDIVPRFNVPLPIGVIGALLKVPSSDLPWLRARSVVFSRPFLQARPGALDLLRAERAIRALLRYFERLIVTQRREGVTGLPRELLDNRDLSHAELLSMYVLLVIAGHETTTNMLGNALLTLIRHPETLGRLRGDPWILPGVVEELMRFEPSVIGIGRMVKHDFEYESVTFRKDQHVTLFLGSANHDEACARTPGAFDIDRSSARHLTFGYGRHACLGAGLVRLELQTALGGLLRRYRQLDLASAPRWLDSAVHRGPRRLLLRVA